MPRGLHVPTMQSGRCGPSHASKYCPSLDRNIGLLKKINMKTLQGGVFGYCSYPWNLTKTLDQAQKTHRVQTHTHTQILVALVVWWWWWGGVLHRDVRMKRQQRQEAFHLLSILSLSSLKQRLGGERRRPDREASSPKTGRDTYWEWVSSSSAPSSSSSSSSPKCATWPLGEEVKTGGVGRGGGDAGRRINGLRWGDNRTGKLKEKGSKHEWQQDEEEEGRMMERGREGEGREIWVKLLSILSTGTIDKSVSVWSFLVPQPHTSTVNCTARRRSCSHTHPFVCLFSNGITSKQTDFRETWWENRRRDRADSIRVDCWALHLQRCELGFKLTFSTLLNISQARVHGSSWITNTFRELVSTNRCRDITTSVFTRRFNHLVIRLLPDS